MAAPAPPIDLLKSNDVTGLLKLTQYFGGNFKLAQYWGIPTQTVAAGGSLAHRRPLYTMIGLLGR